MFSVLDSTVFPAAGLPGRLGLALSEVELSAGLLQQASFQRACAPRMADADKPPGWEAEVTGADLPLLCCGVDALT